MPINIAVRVLSALPLWVIAIPAWGWTSAERYSSAETNASAQLAYRTVTIYTLRDACAESSQLQL